MRGATIKCVGIGTGTMLPCTRTHMLMNGVCAYAPARSSTTGFTVQCGLMIPVLFLTSYLSRSAVDSQGLQGRCDTSGPGAWQQGPCETADVHTQGPWFVGMGATWMGQSWGAGCEEVLFQVTKKFCKVR